ncbi:MAG: DMT family transporter [Phycisphaerales bacterium]
MPTRNAAATAPTSAGGVLLILGTLLSWASIPLFLKFFARPDPVTGVALIDAWTANGWRYGMSAVFWLPLLAVAFYKGKLPRAIFVAAAVPTVFNVAGQTCFAWCPYFLDPGFFTFVFRVQIVFVALGAYMLFPGERAALRSARFWVGAALVVAGSTGLVIFGKGLGSGHSLWAIALAVASGGLFAGYGLGVRYFMHQYPAVLAFGIICQYTAVCVVAMMLVLGTDHGGVVLTFSGFNWLVLVASSMIGIALSHVAYYAAIQRLGVSVSMGIIQLQPVLTAAASVLFGWEQLAPLQWVSGVVGVGGAVLVLMAGKKSGPAPPSAPVTPPTSDLQSEGADDLAAEPTAS